MIEKFTKEQSEWVGKTNYYLSISALQKSVRRGDVERAVNFAKICWRMEPYRLFCRLWTILFEDCGRDVNALLAFYKYRGGYSNFEAMVPLIQAMCSAGKSREVCWLSYWMRGEHLKPGMLIGAVTNTVHERMLELIKEWPDRKFNVYSIWDYGFGDANYDWTIELAERAAKWDREQFCISVPYWFMMDTRELVSKSSNECNLPALYDGWLPLEAMDEHTRPGQHALRTCLKYRAEWLQSIGLSSTYEGTGCYLFWMEGWLYRNYQPYVGVDFAGLGDRMEFLDGVGMSGADMRLKHQETAVREFLPEMAKVRTWLLNNAYQEDVQKLKTVYHDQLWSL